MDIAVLNGVSKRYGEVIALSKFDMRVKQGMINGFVGPNGAGKSTTLRLITGLTLPDNGIVELFGASPITDIRNRERVGFVSEYDDLYSWARVRELMQYMCRLTRPLSGNINDRINNTLIRVGMAKFANRKISSLSKGMKQRVKIGLAILHDPEFLILDEPLSGLDPLGRRAMMDLFRELNRERGVSILISSHILEELEDIVQRIVLIHRGQTIAEGKPERIRELIYSYPHEIVFKTIPECVKSILSEIVQIDGLVQSIKISSEDSFQKVSVITANPMTFYDELVRIAVEKSSPIYHLEAISESVEKLFEYLIKGGHVT